MCISNLFKQHYIIMTDPEIPSESEMKQWGSEELWAFLQSRLQGYSQEAMNVLKSAELKGSVFLEITRDPAAMSQAAYFPVPLGMKYEMQMLARFITGSGQIAQSKRK